MKAVVQDRYGSPREVLRLEDIDTPRVTDDEVLVRIRAAAVNPADWHLITGDPSIARLQWGLRTPNNPVPGCDLAGQVEAVGRIIEAGQVSPVVDRRYSLADVPEAIRYLEEGHARGKVVIDV